MSMMDELEGLVAQDMRDKVLKSGDIEKPEVGWWKMTFHSIQSVQEDERQTIKVDGNDITNPEYGDKIVNIRVNLWAHGGDMKWTKKMTAADFTWRDLEKPRCDFLKINPFQTRYKTQAPDKLTANCNRWGKLQELSGKTTFEDVINHFTETPLYGRWQTNSFNEEANVLMDMKV